MHLLKEVKTKTDNNNNNNDIDNNNNELDSLVDDYLRYLGLTREAPSLSFLQKLQKAHIEKIPHENIDRMLKNSAKFDFAELVEKFTQDNQGGVCFELNYTFAELLWLLGFLIQFRLAHVHAYGKNIEYNPYPTHPIIIVQLGEHQYIADVGWSNYRSPLNLNGSIYHDQTGTYRIVAFNAERRTQVKSEQTRDYNKDSKAFNKNRLVMQVLKKAKLDEKGNLEEVNKANEANWNSQFSFDLPPSPIKSYEPLTFPEGFFGSSAYSTLIHGFFEHNLQILQPTANGYWYVNWNKPTNKWTLVEKKYDSKKTTQELNEVDVREKLQTSCNLSAETVEKCVTELPSRRRSAPAAFYHSPRAEAQTNNTDLEDQPNTDPDCESTDPEGRPRDPDCGSSIYRVRTA